MRLNMRMQENLLVIGKDPVQHHSSYDMMFEMFDSIYLLCDSFLLEMFRSEK